MSFIILYNYYNELDIKTHANELCGQEKYSVTTESILHKQQCQILQHAKLTFQQLLYQFKLQL